MAHPPQIPLTPQTDKRNFPAWEAKAPPGQSGHPYPKMLTRLFTKEDRDQWLIDNRRFDRATREEYYETRVPKIGALVEVLATQEVVDAGLANRVGEAVICLSVEDEKAIKGLLGLSPSVPAAPASADVNSLSEILNTPADKLEAENAKLRALLIERDEMQRKLDTKTPAPAETLEISAKPKRGRPRKVSVTAPPPPAAASAKKAMARVKALSAAQLAGDVE